MHLLGPEVGPRLSLDCHTYTVQFITVKQSLYSYSGLSLILYGYLGSHSRDYSPQLSIITLFQLYLSPRVLGDEYIPPCSPESYNTRSL